MTFCSWKYYAFRLQILLGLLTVAYCQPPELLYSYCPGSGNYSGNSTYETNLNTLLSSLPSSVDEYGFNSSSFGQNQDTVNAIALCRGDVNITTCRECIQNATKKITQVCPNKKEAIGVYDICILRYSNETIYGILNGDPIYYAWNINNVSSIDQFNQDLETFFSGLRRSASNGGDRRKFAAGSKIGSDKVLTIYGFMQCSPDLSDKNCNDCLNSVTNGISKYCSGRIGCKVIAPSCNLRYEIDPFIDSTPSLAPPPPSLPPPPPPVADGKEKAGDGTDTTINIAIVASAVGSVILLII